MNLLVGRDAEWVMFSIFDRPRDHPGLVIVAGRIINKGVPEEGGLPLAVKWAAHSIEEARDLVAEMKPGAACIPRDPSDVPSLVESWF